MHYSEKVYRPPSEANSLILQVTQGCSHNNCAFCSMYHGIQFRVEPMEQIEEDLQEASPYDGTWDRIFLINGNAFVLNSQKLLDIADLIHRYMPSIKTISMYARIDDVARKSVAELKLLRQAGINALYIGSETGSDALLDRVDKGYKAADIVEQCKKLEEAGFDYVLSYLSGLAGKGRGDENAVATAKIYNQLKPAMIGASSLTLFPDTWLYGDLEDGKFEESTELEIVKEFHTLVSYLETKTYFWAGHNTIATPVAGRIPEEKERIRNDLEFAMQYFNEENAKKKRDGLKGM